MSPPNPSAASEYRGGHVSIPMETLQARVQSFVQNFQKNINNNKIKHNIRTSVGDPNDCFSDSDPVFQTDSDSAPFRSGTESE